MKISKIIFNTLLAFSSIFVGILICEFGARKIGLGTPILYKTDTLVGYRLKPNQSIIRRKKSQITTDYEGFRINNEKKFIKESPVIVFVGDSVTYGGSYIDNKNLFSSKYCNIFFNKNIRCLNNGINAWGIHNMSRFITNYDLYSNREPLKFILVILPGDEGRNFKSFSDTPFWNNKPKQPSALNEIVKFVNWKYLVPALQIKNKKGSNKIDSVKKEKVLIQKNTVWDELKYTLNKTKYPIDIIISPPRRWFESQTSKEEIKLYDNFLENLSNLEKVNKTCNLYGFLKNDYEKSFYTDGVHLSNEGHEIWAKKIYECIN